jgi:outer membrane protein OmpA-like peptidoglycan-associated protein
MSRLASNKKEASSHEHALSRAMGTSQQVAPDKTSEGQAENRRVVVKILQNKGIAGT